MVKKQSFIFFIVISFIFMMSLNVWAAYEKVYDEANLLTEQERAHLNDRAMQLSEQTALDVIIVTIDDSEGKSSSQYAEDYYEEHGYGYQGTLDGILFLLNMDEREVYIFTRDLGYDYISNARVEEILDRVYPALAEGSYHESIQIFLTEVERFVETGLSPEAAMDHSGEAGYGNAHYGSTSESSMLKRLGTYLLISLVIGGIVVGIMAMGNQGRSTVNARTYLESNSFAVTKKRDRHYNTIVTRQKIQKNTGGGGGGSSIGRSGGGRIGGGGRKF